MASIFLTNISVAPPAQFSLQNPGHQPTLTRFVSQSKIIPFQNVTLGGFLGGFLTQLTEFAIRDQATWEKVLTMAFCGGTSPCGVSAPHVDFSSTTVLAVFLGWKGSAGYAVRISQVEQKSHILNVHVEITFPGPNCFSAAVLTYPFDIVSIPSTRRAIVFQTETIISNC